MKAINKYRVFSFILLVSALMPLLSYSSDNSAEFLAYPPFITHSVSPNVLVVLDESGSMQWPGYLPNGWYDSNDKPTYAYNSGYDYYGYFQVDEYYKYDTDINKFILQNKEDCSFYNDSSLKEVLHRVGDIGCISGNVLNWFTMSRIDLLRKALYGGKVIERVNNDDPYTLIIEGSKRGFTEHNLGCSFSLGGYSNNRTITIESTGDSIACELDTVYTDYFNDNVLDLDDKWRSIDIGIDGDPTTLTENNNELTVQAGGTTIWGRNDNFHFYYQEMTGDFDIRLHIKSVPQLREWSKSGLMVRNNSDSNSPRIHYVATRDHGLQFAYRNSAGADTYNVVNTQMVSYPVWIRLTRSGQMFSGYYSEDGGNTWKNHGGREMTNLSDHVFVGIATASYSEERGTAVHGDFLSYSNCLGCTLSPLNNASVQLDVTKDEARGVLHSVGDKDFNDALDKDAPHFGLMFYSGNNESSTSGCMVKGVIKGTNEKEGANKTPLSDIIDPINDRSPGGNTPTGPALIEAYDYFKQSNTDSHNCNSNNSDFISQKCDEDLWYENDKPIWCRKSFVLLISDGEWNQGIDPARRAYKAHTEDLQGDIDNDQVLNHFTIYASFGEGSSSTARGRSAMQLTAMYGNFKDVEADDNNLPFDWGSPYSINSRDYTLPSGHCVFPGGWDQRCEEWDIDGPDSKPDGIPDSFFEASEGQELENSLVDALAKISKNSSSGTAVSVLSTTGDGEGATYQAYFYSSRKVEDGLDNVRWMGFLQALFVDKYGNLRANTYPEGTTVARLDYGIDENDPDKKCDETKQDPIIRYYYDDEKDMTNIGFYQDNECDGEFDGYFEDLDGDGYKDNYYQPLNKSETIDEFKGYIWEAGKELHKHAQADRKIYTTVDGKNFTDFSDASSEIEKLGKFLQAETRAEALDIIKYIRGKHVEGYRKRDFKVEGSAEKKVWKLGDIVHSTPTALGKPGENYSLLYKDSSYRKYKNRYRNRRHMIYVGANDGMLHAFNGGFYNENTHIFVTEQSIVRNLSPALDYEFIDSNVYNLGHEIWAYVPKSVLPHLKFYVSPTYQHTYYVDGKPKITDAQIFTTSGNNSESCDVDNIHPCGWGSILIGSMRYGGKKTTNIVDNEYVRVCSDDTSVTCTSNDDCTSQGIGTCSVQLNSAYFAIDITDPNNPELLWTFDDPDYLGLTTSYPAFIKTGKSDDETDSGKDEWKWFVVFGSGPTKYDGTSDQKGSIYVLQISTNNGTGKINTWTEKTNYWRFELDEPDSFVADPIGVDVDLDEDVDVVYIGNTYCPAGATCPPSEGEPSTWAGKMYRINVKNKGNSMNPAEWDISLLLDGTDSNPLGPITSAPSAAMDEQANLWVYFGTGRFLADEDKTFLSDSEDGATKGDRYSFYGVKDICKPWKEDTCGTEETILTSRLSEVSNTEVTASECINSSGGLTGTYCSSDSDCWAKPEEEEDDVKCDKSESKASFKDILFGAQGPRKNEDFVGWKYEFFEAGERAHTKPLVIGGLVIWTTFKPINDICSSEGESFLYAVFYETGTAFEEEVFKEKPEETGKTGLTKRKRLGYGMPSSVGASVRGEDSITTSTQSSTGTIIQLNLDTASPVKSGFDGWKDDKLRYDVLESDGPDQ